MKYIIVALFLISNVALAQVSTAHSKMSITTVPDSKWIAVGQSQFGRPYEITIASTGERDEHNSIDGILYHFTLTSMFHNEYFGLKRGAKGREIHVKTGYLLDDNEMSDMGLISEVPITYEIKHPIFNHNDSLARHTGTIDYLFNPRVTSINFYDRKTLIIYNTLGIFVLKLNEIDRQTGKFVHKLSLLKSSQFSKVGELVVYYVYSKHNDGSLTVEKKRVNGPDDVVSDGTETIKF